MPVILWLVSNWRLVAAVGLVALVLGVVGYINHQNAKLDELQMVLENERRRAQGYETAMKAEAEAAAKYQKEAERALAAIAQAHTDAIKRAKAAQQRAEEILNAKADQDGSVAPVLHDSLDRLRNSKPVRATDHSKQP